MVCVLSGCDREKPSESLYGLFISKIEFRYQGDRTVEEQRLRAFVISKPGDRFTPEAIDSNVKSLNESGLVEDVRFLSKPEGNAVLLIAEVSTRRPFGPPFCIGNTAFSDKNLAGASGLTKDRKVTIEELEKARQKLKAYYVSHGYLGAQVVCRAFQGGDPSPEDYVFVVDEVATIPQASTEEKEAQQDAPSGGDKPSE
jgi:outer membrane protein assembly factor BamA